MGGDTGALCLNRLIARLGMSFSVFSNLYYSLLVPMYKFILCKC